MTEQYVHEIVSQNFRMSEIEAAWLRLALPELDGDVDRAGAIAARYRQAAPRPALAGRPPGPRLPSRRVSQPPTATRRVRALEAARRRPPRSTTRWRSPSNRPTAT